MPKCCPVFEKDGNRFIVPYDDYVGETVNEAMMIGWGMMLIECVIWGAKFTGDIVDVGDELPHLKAELNGTTVALISGVIFEEVSSAEA